ncbi:MAG: hypothetical protein J0H19_23490 [Rhodospirillales bacterium]|nr:hypothetical protein [Rhodospirillales bacterium]
MNRPTHARPRRRAGLPLLLGVLGLCTARPAWAEDQAPSQWHFDLTPYLWVAGVTGSVSTKLSRVPTQTVSADFGDVLTHLNAIPVMGALEVRNGRYGLLTDLIAISVKTDISTKGVLYSGGSAQLTQFVGTAIGAYRVLSDADQTLDMGVGVRAIGLSTEFTLNGNLLGGRTASPGASWANVIGAIRYRYSFSPDWSVTAYGDVGGGPSSAFTWQVLGTVDYQLSKSTTLRAGYRYLAIQYGSGIYQNVGLGGPLLAATIRF